MPIPLGITRINRDYLNRVMIHLAGKGWLVDLEHVGRRSGRVRHTPLIAIRTGETMTIALTYGSSVQWLKNIRAAGRCRMRMRDGVATLGAPRTLDPRQGRARMPQPARTLLRWPVRCNEYIELPILAGPAPIAR